MVEPKFMIQFKKNALPKFVTNSGQQKFKL
jgi:hypothetical protein